MSVYLDVHGVELAQRNRLLPKILFCCLPVCAPVPITAAFRTWSCLCCMFHVVSYRCPVGCVELVVCLHWVVQNTVPCGSTKHPLSPRRPVWTIPAPALCSLCPYTVSVGVSSLVQQTLSVLPIHPHWFSDIISSSYTDLPTTRPLQPACLLLV